MVDRDFIASVYLVESGCAVKPFWTKSGARLTAKLSQKSMTTPRQNLNWIFLPGGPGLGSESLASLTDILDLGGTVWHLDLPGDGSNRTDNDAEAFSHWQEALIEAVSALPPAILVAHSTGGMYALATPTLEDHLVGMILMDSAPDASWQQHFGAYAKAHPLSDQATHFQELYERNPTDETLKNFTLAAIPYLRGTDCFDENFEFMNHLPYNFAALQWSAEHFDGTYQAQWVPFQIPTLIFAGQNDHITPLSLFQNAPAFQRDNILIREIPQAGHFPWIEKPSDVVQVFGEFSETILERK